MLFNLNEFLMSVSFAIDFVEMDILGVTSNHGKRVAYIGLKVAREIGLSSKELHDVVALGILHDNGASEKSLHDRLIEEKEITVSSLERSKEHCIIGEENVRQYPFQTEVENVIKYHHECYDGSGFFNLRGEEIPQMAQILKMGDILELSFNLDSNDCKMQKEVVEFVRQQQNKIFSPKLVTAFCNVAKNEEFWSGLKGDFVGLALKEITPRYNLDLTLEEIRKITGVFSKIIDSKSKFTRRHSSNLSEKAAIMADFYKKDKEEKLRLIIAADLHDIGKLAVPNRILDSTNKLTADEFKIVKDHPYYTRLALQQVKGFEDITEWAANHHEKLNGQGYPFSKTSKELDFNSRLMACLDIYEALTEDRPYRKPLSHKEAMETLNKMKEDGLVDYKITYDIDNVFKNFNK